MNEPARYLSGVITDNVRPTRPAESPAVILWAMIVAWWEWCREQAAPGWMLVLAVTIALFTWLIPWFDAQTTALLKACL